MLPPHNSDRSLPPPVLHRLLDPARLIDWHEALISFEYALLRPNKLAKQCVQRHHIINRLSRDDPGLVLLVLLLNCVSGSLYYLALRPQKPLIRYFFLTPLLWTLGTMCGAAALLYIAIVYLLTAAKPPSVLVHFGNRLNRSAQLLKNRLWNVNRASEHTLPHVLVANLDQTSGVYLNYDLYLHCLDTILNAAVPYLFILGPLQYVLLPLTIPNYEAGGSDSAVMQFARCGVANCFHAVAMAAALHALSCNLNILPIPATALAGYAHAGIMVAAAAAAALLIARTNLNQIYFSVFYGI